MEQRTFKAVRWLCTKEEDPLCDWDLTFKAAISAYTGFRKGDLTCGESDLAPMKFRLTLVIEKADQKDKPTACPSDCFFGRRDAGATYTL